MISEVYFVARLLNIGLVLVSEKIERVLVPPILKMVTRGVRAKIWAFLNVNEEQWFTSKEISKYLEMPLSTVQVALRTMQPYTPRIKSVDKDRTSRGRPEKTYKFQRVLRFQNDTNTK